MLGRWLGQGWQARGQENYLADVNLRTGKFEGEPGKFFAVGNIFFQVRPQIFQYVNLRAQKKIFEHVNLRTGKFEDEPGNFFADQVFFFQVCPQIFQYVNLRPQVFLFEVGFARWRAKPASWNRSHLRPLLSAVHAPTFLALGGRGASNYGKLPRSPESDD